MKRVIILGAGGHAKVVAEILRLSGKHEIAGFLDSALIGKKIGGFSVLGGDDLLPRLRADGVMLAFIGVGGTGNNAPRMKIFERVAAMGFAFVNAIHPAAVLSDSVKLGQGIAVMACAVINPGAEIGDNVIISTGAIVEHDCKIEAHVHVSPGAVLCGGVRVGTAAHIGAGAVIRQSINIAESAIVGAGAVVVKNVVAHSVVAGVPARIMREVGK